MANYQHKRSPVAGKIPLAGDLLEGEIAVNIKDRKLFAKDDQGSVFEFLGGNLGGVETVNGVTPVAGNITLNALNIPPTADRLWLTQAERQLIANFAAYNTAGMNSLSDVTNVTTARTDLKLGTVTAFNAKGALKTEDELQAEADIVRFKIDRQAQLDSAIVTISTGKSFDADEKSVSRLQNAITYIKEHNVTEIPWSTADVESGIMVTCSADEIIEAHKLAVENMTALWTFNQNQ